MTDIPTIMHAIYAVESIREKANTDLDEVLAILYRALPADDPGTRPRVPQGREARKRYWAENGIRASLSHSRKVTQRKSKAMKKAG